MTGHSVIGRFVVKRETLLDIEYQATTTIRRVEDEDEIVVRHRLDLAQADVTRRIEPRALERGVECALAERVERGPRPHRAPDLGLE